MKLNSLRDIINTIYFPQNKIVVLISKNEEDYIQYLDGPINFQLPFKLSKTAHQATINIPSTKEWTDKTGLPIFMRDKILVKLANNASQFDIFKGKADYKINPLSIEIFVP